MRRSLEPRLSGIVVALLVFLLATPVAAWTEAYCSPQNTGDTDVYTQQFMSNGNCTTHCRDLSDAYAFAVIQYKDCYCSNYIPRQQEDVSRCRKVCPGYGAENCGNIDDGLFIYIQNGRPSGTQAAPSSAQPTSKTPSPASSNASTSEQTPNTITVVQTTVILPAPVVTRLPVLILTPTVSPFTASSKPQPTSQTKPPEVASSIEITTESGTIVTRIIYITPSGSLATSSTAPVRSGSSNSGPNIGAIAGGVAGGVIGLLAIVGGIVFFLWRKRNQQQQAQDGEIGSNPGGITRNTSTMSKAGLLGTTREVDHPYPPRIATNVGTQNSRYGADHESISPRSNRRNSQPLVIDSRLNPNAVMTFAGASMSRESVASLDDSRDYGRQLNVRNPDP